ncbi:MAG: tyrosine-type recombinase/integrase [Gammaproteobacteria bacterium]|nr:tyrosine-type recombinase/integrase [Gammaproteobacteria bacterium]
MTTYIERAVSLCSGADTFEIINPAHQELATVMKNSHALPDGFCFLVYWESQQIVEPVLLYLQSKFLDSRGSYRPNTQIACVNDLKDWWSHLAYIKKAWDKIDEEDVKQYRDVMKNAVSPKTHQIYDVKTVNRRTGTVLDFYDWAQRRNLYGLVLDQKEFRKNSRPIDSDALAHTHGRGEEEVSAILLPDHSAPDDNVRPLSPKEIKMVMNQLGPLPSEQDKVNRSSRNRLTGECALNSGLRADEIAQLGKYQILNLTPEPNMPYGVCRLHITKTKGLVPRWVEIPNWLVVELHLYIEGERSECIRMSRKHWCKRKADEANALFVNSTLAKSNVGRNISSATISRAFSDAIITSGITIRKQFINPETGESYIDIAAAHSFHDLRHTFAVWLYHSEIASGNAEPWKQVQSLLGHKYLATTLDIYLRVVDSFERNVSDVLYKNFQEMRNYS